MTEEWMEPTANESRDKLPLHRRELFDWLTTKLLESGMFYGSLLQAIASWYPTISYWGAVETLKRMTERDDWPDIVRKGLADARATSPVKVHLDHS